MLFIDLNSFKQVNDTYGHDVGDQLLKGVVERIENELSGSDLICRIGGDEFVILLSNVDEAYVKRLISSIEGALQIPFLIDGFSMFSSASIGVSFSEFDDFVNLEEMIQQADAAMYTAKDLHREKQKV